LFLNAEDWFNALSPKFAPLDAAGKPDAATLGLLAGDLPDSFGSWTTILVACAASVSPALRRARSRAGTDS
jgi:hypothetical protein